MSGYYFADTGTASTACYYGNNWTTTASTSTYAFYGNTYNSTATYAYTPVYYTYVSETPRETDAQRTARLERERVAREQEAYRQRIVDQQVKEREVKRASAEVVAQKLIEEVFGAEKLQEYRTKKLLSVDSPSKAGRRYVVRPDRGLEVFEGDKLVDVLCVHLFNPDKKTEGDRAWLPDADIVCGKAILLLSDEERLLKVANHSPR